ncbi:pirin family protein [Clostridium perfringens]|uniref:Pirin family protein n=1 Tax=Clostridium perfringens (strain ATCC 13124 / DSM 756 / JCM 1290 / NCIMB 6125 / NCTC 8237 / Type A) TaxID=195103 RepID=A0A0H2YU01_CLOP1|nr:pirin family protein [Clostridium perfringens]STB11218.1 pirin [Clostridium novyi]ABG84027.1 pirin family protein [Clostridium perfringens ATCC 13124]EHK2335224.1 pirin family protein [Clostridium perfringens]EIF6297156.1 pirin family protein [Clostridium perfringens]EJT6171175.1 pirin family protein [Clostridium perfringens]
MKKFRTIENIFKAPEPHMVGDGFRVSQYIPTGIKSMERLSPFLLLDYNAPYYFKPSETRLGVGAHPHRGFETVTIAYDGKVEHHDNKGNHGIIGPGDVQWMTAASGIMHKEYHETEFSKNGGIFHMVQLWVNLPKDKKMIEPKYQPLLKEEMGVLKLDNDKGEISIIAGEVNGVKGPANTFTNINLYNINLKNYGNTTLSEPKNFNTAILILKGEAKVNEDKICKEGDFIVFENVEGEILLESLTEESLFLVLSGEPINEPVVSHGPFVMNTLGEILDAYEDFRNNKFGTENF